MYFFNKYIFKLNLFLKYLINIYSKNINIFKYVIVNFFINFAILDNFKNYI